MLIQSLSPNRNSGKSISGPSTALELKNILLALKKESIAGIVLDLRNNNSAQMQQLNAVVGLFLEGGPFFQYRHNSDELESQPIETIVPADFINQQALVVMTNYANLGVSEILSAALQDYQRAVVVGYPTYGLGDGSIMPSLSEGYMLMAGYEGFRVTGQSMKDGGVTPDVRFAFEHCNINRKLAFDESSASSHKQTKNISP